MLFRNNDRSCCRSGKRFVIFGVLAFATAFFCLLGLVTVRSASGVNEVEDIAYTPTPGETAIVFEEEKDGVKLSVEVFPKEAYFGDPIYIAGYAENLGDKVGNVPGIVFPMWQAETSVRISSDALDGEYTWRFENPTGERVMYSQSPYNLKPGEKICNLVLVAELCPLEDLNAPFWTELRERSTSEGILCTVEVQSIHGLTATFDVLVKPRPDAEMALLEEWYEKTPESLFPFTGYTGKRPNSGKSDVRVGTPSKSYSPWSFIRTGNRKPSDPNNPTTIAGWRELESSLAPSTMRDEIRWTRLKLEYFDALGAKEESSARKACLDWLSSLPDPQQETYRRFMLNAGGRNVNSSDPLSFEP